MADTVNITTVQGSGSTVSSSIGAGGAISSSVKSGAATSTTAVSGNSFETTVSGAAGPQGPPGNDGADGYTPIKGVDYFDGADGSDGYTPVKGVDYFDGANGADGYTPVKGTDYFDGEDGREVELQKSATHVQWRYTGGSWTDLVALSELKGDTGDTGENGADGANGQEIELQTTATHIQWRYVGDSWTNLIALSEITGPAGADGADGAGLPAGGTSGQQLVKQSATDYDYAWQTPAGAGDMLASMYDPQSIEDDAFDRANHTGTQAISTVSGLQTALDGKEPSRGADDNYVTNAEKVVIGNTSGINTGDQDISNLVTGPASTVDNTIPRFDSTTGKIIQSSGYTIGDDDTLLTDGLINSTTIVAAPYVAASVVGEYVEDAGVIVGDVHLGDGLVDGVDVSALETTVGGKANTSHTHPTTDLTATGGSSTSFLRKDNTWATPTNTTYAEITSAEITAGTASTARAISGRRAQEIVTKAQTGVVKTTGNQAIAGDLDVDGDIYSNGEKVSTGSGFKIGTFSAGGSLGHYTVSGVGFRPKLVELEWIASSSNMLSGHGAMDSHGNQFSQSSYVTSNSTRNTEGSSTKCFITADASSTTREAEFVSMNVDGFTINFTKSASDTDLAYKAYA